MKFKITEITPEDAFYGDELSDNAVFESEGMEQWSDGSWYGKCILVRGKMTVGPKSKLKEVNPAPWETYFRSILIEEIKEDV